MKRLFGFRANGLVFASLFLVVALPASATMLVDRGLPTSNVNTGTSSQANVAWADYETSTTPSEYWLPGDSFSIGGAGNYQVTDIRVWVVGGQTGLSLLGGVDGGTMGTISSSYSASSVTYNNGQTYQNQSGGFENLYQIDFTVNLDLAAGQTFDFFLNGPWTTSGAGYVNAYLHASNAALSGSPQDGSDGTFLWLDVNGASQTVETWDSATGAGTTPGFGPGWDKNSDGNVQVFGVSTPDTGNSLFLLGLGFVGLAVFGFRQNRLAMAK